MMKSTSLICAASLLLAPSLALAATTTTTMSKTAINQAQARKDIELDGYTKIENLHQGKNGWVATASEDGKPVQVEVNSMGVKKL